MMDPFSGSEDIIMNWTVFVAYAKSVWAVGGPLVGVLIGAYIANRNQRKNWIADCKKEEYRELLSVVASAYAKLLSVRHKFVWNDEARDIQLQVASVLRDRIFIAKQLLRLDAMNRWVRAFEKL
jgi:hypothetical protein